MEENPLLPIGGGYRLVKLIGRGGFGEVWKAEAPGGFFVAVKRLRRPADHEERTREVRALEVIKSLNHHFLIRTHASFHEQDELVIVMDLAECSLRDRLKESRAAGATGLPPGELIGYFRESAEALDYLHGKHVLHRDVKPDNILLIEGHARLADFGLARRQEASQLSVSGSGTLAYMPPEVWRGKACEASDQYSLAYAYGEMRLGRRPFPSTDYVGVMMDHLDRVPDLTPLPESEKQVLLRALAKDPAERFPCCMDFARALEKALAGQTSGTAALTAPAAGAGAVGQTLIPDTRDPTDPQPSSAPIKIASGLPSMQSEQPTPEVSDTRTSPPPPKLWIEPPPPPPPRWRWLLLAAGLLLLIVVAGVIAIFAGRKKPDLALRAPGPLTVRVGEEKPLVLEIERDHLDGPVELSFTAPPGVTVRASDLPAGVNRVEVPIAVGADVDPGEKTITVVARGGSLQREAVVSLRIKPAVFLPAGFKPVGDKVETDLTGREYFERIVLERPDGPAVTFVLVPRKAGDTDDTPTFYVMEYKVWNDLFARFIRVNPRPTQWQAGKDTEWLPALNVTASEAAALARWLGGRLPTTEQWDKAAGFFRQDGRAGPAKGPSVAVRRYGEGPRPVNCSPNDDVSPYGVRDLAGNGYEWTRNLAGEPGKTVPLEGEPEGPRRHLVILRGKSYRAPAPLTYADLEYQRKQGQALVQYYDAASPVTGFRVVIEPASRGR